MWQSLAVRYDWPQSHGCSNQKGFKVFYVLLKIQLDKADSFCLSFSFWTYMSMLSGILYSSISCRYNVTSHHLPVAAMADDVSTGWDFAFEPDNPHPEPSDPSELPHEFKKPKRGGAVKVGSKAFRDSLNQELQQEQQQQQLDMQAQQALEPQPGDIAYARQARQLKQQQKRQQQQAHSHLLKDNPKQLVSLDGLMPFGPPDLLLAVGTPLQRMLGAVLGKVLGKEIDTRDELIQKTLEGKTLACSSRSVASMTDEDASLVQKQLVRVGAAVFETGNWMWGTFISHLLRSGEGEHRPILCVFRLRYDETPTKVRVVYTQSDGHLFALGTKIGNDAVSQMFKSALANQLPQDESQPASHAKILQTELSVGFLFAKKSQDQSEERLVWLNGPVPTCLQAVDHLNGETTRACVWHSISSIAEIQRIWSQFPMKVRVSCADKAGANFRCEAGLQEPDFMEGFTSVHAPCDVHRLSICIGISNALVDDDVSGLLNAGLVCNELSSTKRLRDLLRHIFENELVIESSLPPDGSETIRNDVYDMFLPVSNVTAAYKNLNRKRRAILSEFLNGNLHDDCITHHCPFYCCGSTSVTMAYMLTFVTWALVPFRLPIYSRKSWIGQNYCLDWVGLLEAHHSLFTRVMTLYVGPAKSPPTTDAGPIVAAEADPPTCSWEGAWLDECAALSLEDQQVWKPKIQKGLSKSHSQDYINTFLHYYM